MIIVTPIAIPAGTPALDQWTLDVDFTAESYDVTAADDWTDTILLSTNVAEDDYPAWVAGSYDAEDRVILGHDVYEALVTTTDAPDVGVAEEVPTWVLVGATNRWRMFDGIISEGTSNPGTVAVDILPGQVVNAFAAFGLSGSELRVTMTDPVDGVVYDRIVALQDNSAIVDHYAYFFNPIVRISDPPPLLDLPAYGQATVSVSIDAGDEAAVIGEMVLGRQQPLGAAVFGTTIGQRNYSVKSEDRFGKVTIIPGGYKTTCDYDIAVPTNKVAGARKLLTDIRDIPVVFIGDPARPETVVYGFYRNFSIVLSTPSMSDCSIETESLI